MTFFKWCRMIQIMPSFSLCVCLNNCSAATATATAASNCHYHCFDQKIATLLRCVFSCNSAHILQFSSINWTLNGSDFWNEVSESWWWQWLASSCRELFGLVYIWMTHYVLHVWEPPEQPFNVHNVTLVHVKIEFQLQINWINLLNAKWKEQYVLIEILFSHWNECVSAIQINKWRHTEIAFRTVKFTFHSICFSSIHYRFLLFLYLLISRSSVTWRMRCAHIRPNPIPNLIIAAA